MATAAGAGMVRRRSFRTNVAVGLISSAWSAVATIIATPIYLHTLSVEAYGLIAFFLTLQGICLLLDLGFSTTINREVALAHGSGDHAAARNLLATTVLAYSLLTMLVCGTLALSSGWIARTWLSAATLPPPLVRSAVQLMALTLACRLPVGLYLGALQGAHRSADGALVGIVAVTLSAFGAIAAIQGPFQPILAFFVWQAVVATLQLAVTRALAWRSLGGSSDSHIDIALFRRTASFTAAIALTTVIGTLVTQLDKLVVSATASLADVGRYGLATLVARPILLAVAPLFTALYPLITTLVNEGSEEAIGALYAAATRAFSSVVMPLIVWVALFSGDLVLLWTGNAVMADHLRLTVSLLTAGYTLNAFMFLPHALQLAYGHAGIPLKITIGMLVALVVGLGVGVPDAGIDGAAAAWLGANLVNVALSLALTHRRVLRGTALRWLVKYVIGPALPAIAVLASVSALLRGIGPEPRLVLSAVSVLLCYVAVFGFSKASRDAVRLLIGPAARQ